MRPGAPGTQWPAPSPRACTPRGRRGSSAGRPRQAAILALEAWEAALGAPITTWAAEAVDSIRLPLVPDLAEDVNAYYDRDSGLTFYHHEVAPASSSPARAPTSSPMRSGTLCSTRCGPTSGTSPTLEVGGFHEAFGDVTAILTALSDKATRKALLAASPDLGTANFVEGTGEDLSDVVRQVIGAGHSASKPRRALNVFQYQLPETMPTQGGPDDLLARFTAWPASSAAASTTWCEPCSTRRGPAPRPGCGG